MTTSIPVLDICELCGFGFVFNVIKDDGSVETKTFYDNKLKLTQDRLNSVVKALPGFVLSDPSADYGVCKRCYRTIGKIVKREEEIYNLKMAIINPRNSIISKIEQGNLSFCKDICELCGTFFEQTLQRLDGSTYTVRAYEKKLKFTKQILDAVIKAFPTFAQSDLSLNNGVCRDCFRTVEKINKQTKVLCCLRDAVTQTLPKNSRSKICAQSSSNDLIEMKVLKTPTPSENNQRHVVIACAPIEQSKEQLRLNEIKEVYSSPQEEHSPNSDLCELCGFSFVQATTQPDGLVKIETLYNNKFRLNAERLDSVKKVLPGFAQTDPSSKNGICRKCFRLVEKICKQKDDMEQLKIAFERSRNIAEEKIVKYTPQEEYGLYNDICELCGNSFILTAKQEDGSTQITKLYEKKLKLTKEKVNMVLKALPGFVQSDPSLNNGLCKKCCRNIERLLKYEDDLLNLKIAVATTRNAVFGDQKCMPPVDKESVTMNVAPEKSSSNSTVHNIMAQYRQIACRISPVTGTLTETSCTSSSGTVLGTLKSFQTSSENESCSFSSSKPASSIVKSLGSQPPSKNEPLGLKRTAVETPMVMSLWKKAKSDSNENEKNGLEFVEKLGKQPFLFDPGSGISQNSLIIPVQGKMLKVKLPDMPLNLPSWPMLVPVDIGQPSCTDTCTGQISTKNVADIDTKSSHTSCEIKVEPMDDGYKEATGCSVDDNPKVSLKNEEGALTVNRSEEALPLCMEIQEHVSLQSEGHEEKLTNDELEAGSRAQDTGIELNTQKLPEDDAYSFTVIKQEPEEDYQPHMYIVPKEDSIESPPTSQDRNESSAGNQKKQEALEASPLSTTSTVAKFLLHQVTPSQTVYNSGNLESFKNCKEEVPERNQSNDTCDTENIIIQENIDYHSGDDDMNKQEVKKGGHHPSANSFVQLLASSSLLTGYQLFFQSKVFSGPQNGSLHTMPFNVVIGLVDKEWDNLDKKSKEMFENCAKTIHASTYKQQEVQTEPSSYIDGNLQDAETVTDNPSSATQCEVCKTKQNKLIENERRIKDLEKQLEEERKKNKELVELALKRTIKTE